MVSDRIWQRADLIGTQVITRDLGKRLGVVSQIWVDVDQREVVALALRENMLSGLVSAPPQYMLLSSICQLGDVILVENESAIEDILDVDGYSKLINSEVITEVGEPLGRVRGYRFNVEDGKIASLIIASLGLPQVPDQLVSTYELPIEEIVSSGPDRLIVFEGAETRLNQITVGVLERLGIGRAPWERDDEDEYIMPTTPASNQLGKGTVVSNTPPLRANRPSSAETWDEDTWERPAMRPPVRRPAIEPTYYAEEEEYEEDNWSEATGPARYQKAEVEYEEYEAEYEDAEYEEEYEYEDVYDEPGAQVRREPKYVDAEPDRDPWADEGEPYQPQRINIPEKAKAPEYEDGGY